MRKKTYLLVLLLPFILISLELQAGNAPKAFGASEKPKDIRLNPLKDLNGYFPFSVPSTKSKWDQRSERLKHRIATVLGIWPEPEKTALNPVIHSKKDFDGYSVSNVYFESLPGYFVTGNLYLPSKIEGKVPAILSPHGHWSNGRFYDNGNVASEIANGAERFLDGGRSPMQSRCVQLARMGCIVFHYDMIGYADSNQISYELAHRFAKQREDLMNGEKWGFFSPKAEAYYQSIMGLQTWNSIRALDFVCDMPEVDQDRLGVTGASGGGTQTFLLAALDDRVDLSIPAVMVSTAMQGGCTCENASGLRIGTGNVEFAALFAPKPQGLIAANDWTVAMELKGFPELKRLYSLAGKPGNVELKALTHFDHNYNYVSRTAMYEWVNKHFALGHKAPILEKEYKLLSSEEMTVWNDDHPEPTFDPDFEPSLLRQMAQTHWQNLLPKFEENQEEFKEILHKGWEVVIGRSWADVGNVEWDLSGKKEFDHYLEMPGTINNLSHSESLPVIFLYPTGDWNGETNLVLSEYGKSSMYDNDGSLKSDAIEALKNGSTILLVDLLFQGEFNDSDDPITIARKVNNPREAACFTQGYNHSLCAKRVHDVMTCIKFLRTYKKGPSKVNLIASEGVAHIALAASVMVGRENVSSIEADPGDFRFAELDSIRHPDFLPGAMKFGGIRALKFLNGMDAQE